MRFPIVLAGVILLSAGAAQAQMAHDQDAPACKAMDADLTAPLMGWTSKGPAQAATTAVGAQKTPLALGQAVTATLPATGDVSYAMTPAKPGAPDSHGGVLAFTVETAGTYVVALSAGAWIDVVRDGKAIESTAHGHGPACSTVRKAVDFPLQAGAYLLQISGAPADSIDVLVARR